MSSHVTQDDVWKVIDLLFSKREDLYKHQFENYDFFIEQLVPYEIKNNSTIDEHEDAENNLFYSYRFVFSNINFKPAVLDNGTDYMTPMMARYRHLTYFGTVIADVKQIQEKMDTITGEITVTTVAEEKAVPVAKLPIMVKSKYCATSFMPEKRAEECLYDPGCYFIVHGSEKVVLSIERMAPNKIYVYERKKDGDSDYRASITSQKDHVGGIFYGFNIYLRMKEGSGILLSCTGLTDIPVVIVLRALGISTDEELVKMVMQKPVDDDLEMVNALRVSLDECVDEAGNHIRTQEEAMEYIARKTSGVRFFTQNQELRIKQKRMYVDKLLNEDMLPHIEGNDSTQKGIFMCCMIQKLLMVVLKRSKADDRDTFINKRVEMPGILLGQLFRQNWSKMIKECGIYFRKKNINDDSPVKVINQIRPLTIEQSMKSALLTGRWGLSKTKHGIARVLERLSFIKSVAHFRRIVTPTMDEKNSKISSMRHVHPSQVGFLCIVETPEGEKIGLVKNLALSASITTPDINAGYAVRMLLKSLKEIKNMNEVQYDEYWKYFKVMVNGDYVGLVEDPKSVLDGVTDAKIRNKINKYIGVLFDAETREIRIYTDGGRLIRPLLRINQKDLRPYLTKSHVLDIDLTGVKSSKVSTWEAFINKYPEVIEYIDIEQSPYSLISLYISDLDDSRKLRSLPPQSVQQDRVNRYTNMYTPYNYCELHPAINLGMSVGSIPFCNMNQSPRNLFQYAQANQAMGIYCTNWMNRFDISNVLYNPQVPIVSTRQTEYIGLMDLPNGENVIVAIAPYTGYNQEDSMVLNATSVARGLFWSTNVKKYSSTIEKNQVSSQDDIHMKPDRNLVSNIKADVNYDKLNDQGFVPEETKVVNGDAILGKVSPIQPSERTSKVFKDKSEIYKGYNTATVDKVITGLMNGEGYEMIQMRLRSERIPQIGDKFCFTDDHEVLTTEGWVSISEVTLKHKVACLVNGTTLEYQHPTEVVNFDHEGKMYNVESKKVSLCVTPNHQMWVGNREGKRYSLKKAEDLYGKRVCYQNNVDDWKPEPCPEIEGNKFILPAQGRYAKLELDLESWCTFFGIWIAEGCCVGNYVQISANKQRVKDALEQCNKQLSFHFCKGYDKKHDTEKNSWRITHTQLVSILKHLSVGAIHKRLPKWCFHLDMHHSQKLLEGMILGDGHHMKGTTTIRYDTSSKGLADDFMRLCLHAGWAATSYIRYKAGHGDHEINGRLVQHTVDAHRITLCKTQNRPLVNSHIGDGKQVDSWTQYEGKVYCCTVPSHVLYVRRNGRPIWCGNSSRSGQKSTTGLMLRQEEMPFTEDGIVPDIIINPNCIPSRMTIGQLLECVTAKSGSLKGELRDGTAFERRNVEDLCQELEDLGFNRYGYETVYSGITGKKMDAMMFIGPTFYQRLKHLVADKIHARASGPTVLMTRQPPEGRTKNGGFRFGEMERDGAIAHGMACFLKERMMEASDKYQVHVCDRCGLIATKVKNHSGYCCHACNNTVDVSLVEVPYCFKLLMQELMAIGIVPRLKTDKMGV